MFLSIQKLVKLMKESYKSGRLQVGNVNDGLLIGSGWWLVWINNQHVCNKIKGTIVEFAGQMPNPGEMFAVSKSEPELQYEMSEKLVDMIGFARDAKRKLTITPVMLTEVADIRILQALNGDIYGIKQEQLDMVDPGAVDVNIESMPTGPCFYGDECRSIYWYNDYGTVVILPSKIKNMAIAEALKVVEFAELGE